MTKQVKPSVLDFDSAGPYLTIDEWCLIRRASRPTCYRILAAGRLRAVKAGHRTLIETASAIAEATSLPAAVFRTAPSK